MIKNAPTRAFSGSLCLAAVLLAPLVSVGCRPNRAVPPGYLGVVEYDERLVSFEVPGRILEVRVKEGDAVKSGDVLARLDDALQKLARDARASEVKVAEADLALLQAGARKEDVGALAARLKSAKTAEELLKKSSDRAHGLFDKGTFAFADLEKIDSDLARAGSERRALENQLSALIHGARPEELARVKARIATAGVAVGVEEEKLAKYTVEAKVAGTILDVHVDPGELAGAGAPVATLADTAHPYVDVFVPQGEIAGVVVGAKATVRTDATGQTFTGSVEHVARRTEFTPRFLFSERERPNLVVRVRVRVDDPERRLHAGVPAFVGIVK